MYWDYNSPNFVYKKAGEEYEYKLVPGTYEKNQGFYKKESNYGGSSI